MVSRPNFDVNSFKKSKSSWLTYINHVRLTHINTQYRKKINEKKRKKKVTTNNSNREFIPFDVVMCDVYRKVNSTTF